MVYYESKLEVNNLYDYINFPV